jgi:chloramphenicol 3-O phosphotransferase
MSGRIVILNGVPRSGKSSIAKALQVRALWLNLGVDVWMAATPERLQPGIGLRPGGERPELEPVVQQLYAGLFEAIAAAARAGLDVVSDLGLHDGYSRPLGIVDDMRRRLSGLPVLLVGVHCPIEVIMARRNADPQDGRYVGGEGVPAPVARWQEAVHRGMAYDLEVDTAVMSPEVCAEAIEAVLTERFPPPSAATSLRS